MKLPHCAIAIVFSTMTVIGSRADDLSGRPPSMAELQELFTLATAQPQRSKLVADITKIEPPKSQAQVQELMTKVNSLLKDLDLDKGVKPKRLEQLNVLRSNQVAAYQSGYKRIHVRDWYSGYYSRRDYTDAASTSIALMKSNDIEYQSSTVNIHDPKFSPYANFTVNWVANSALLDRDESHGFHLDGLWRIACLDDPLMFMVTGALIDSSSIPTNRTKQPQVDLTKFRMDPRRAQQLIDGKSKLHKIAVEETALDHQPCLVYSLSSRFEMDIDQGGRVCEMEARCWVGRISGRLVLLQGTITNLTLKTSFSSQRDNFDTNGLAHTWTTRRRNEQGEERTWKAEFQEIDLQPKYTDEDVFRPKFPKGFFVTDITAGGSVVVQKPTPKFPVRQLKPSQAKRNVLLVILGAFTALPLFVLWFRRRETPRAECSGLCR